MKKNLKKLFLLFAVIAMAVVCFALSASALDATGQCGDNVYWEYNSSTGELVISGTGAMTDYEYSFSSPFYESNIKSVVINEGVTTIGDYAFFYCESLTEVTIPDSVTTIGDYAFDGNWLEGNSSSLKKVTIGDSVTTIGDYAFCGCVSLTEVTIPDSVTTIGKGAFWYCSSLTEVTIPDSVTTIGDSAFSFCDSLTDITVDENNQYFSNDEYGVLFNKDKTTLIQYLIGNKRTAYTIPDSVTTIGYRAFYSCGSLTEVTIPDSVTTIGEEAFAYFYSLTEVTIPDSVTTIAYRAFYDCYSLTDVYYGGTQEQWKNISIGSYNSYLTGATIHYEYYSHSHTDADSDKFCDICEEYTEKLYKSGECGDNVTYEWYEDGMVIISGTGPMWNCGYDWDDDYNKEYSPFYNSDIKSVVIDKGVTSIGGEMFENCAKLESVFVSDSVVYAGYDAFYGCYSVENVYAIDLESWLNINFENYDDYAFGEGGCNPLSYGANLFFEGEIVTDLVIPEGITEVKEYSFYGCDSLESVTISDSVTEIGYDAFYGCKNIECVYVSDINTWLDINLGYSRGDFYVEGVDYSFGANPLSNGADLYFDSELVKDIVIPEGEKEIKPYAFYGCTGIESVTIPESITKIGYNAFGCCSNIDSVYAKNIESWININFVFCCAVSENYFEFWNTNYIYGYASNPLSQGADLYFDGKLVAGDIVIPDGTKKIDDCVFYNYKNIKSVTIPVSVTEIGYRAFDKCDNFSTVYYKGSKAQWNKINLLGDGILDGDWLDLESQWIDNATIHYEACNPTERAQQNPTCTKVGYTAGVYCSACDDWHSGHEEIAKIPHKYTKYTSDKNATLLADGTKTALCDYGCKNKKTVTDTGSKLVLGDVTGLNATQTTTSVTLKWNKAKNATGYSIYYKLSGDLSWRECVSYTTATSYTFKNLPEGTAYTFAVRSVGKTSSKTFNGSYIAVKTATKAVKPATVVASQNTSAIKLTWSPCKGATGYRIYYKSGSSWKVAVSTTNMTSHTFKNLKAGAKYTFAIRPYVKNGGVVVWSDYTGFITATKPATVKATATSASKGKIALSWNAVNGAEVYEVYYKTGNGSFKLYKTVNASTKNLAFSNLKSGTKYTFAVRGGINTSKGYIYGGYTSATVTVK